MTDKWCVGTTDEQEIFDNMKKTNATLLKRLSGRLFFVVNKVDTSKFCTGASIEQCRKSVAERVTKAMDLPDFVLKPEQASVNIVAMLAVLLMLLLGFCGMLAWL